MQKIHKHKSALSWYLIAAISTVFAALAWAGMHVYAERELRYRHQVESFVKNTNDAALQNVLKWRSRIISTASAISDDPFFSEALANWLEHPQSHIKTGLETRLRALTERDEFTKILLLDTSGQALLSSAGAKESALSAHEFAALERAFSHAEAVVIEPYQQQRFAYPTWSVVTPLYQGLQPLGVLWMEVDLRASLFPLLAVTQEGRATAETVLFQQEEQDVIHLNPLRHHESQPLQTLASSGHFDEIAKQAFSGIRGVLYGKDYRQHDVLAASGVVPDSPWILVTKVDVAEAFADDQRKEGVFFGLLIGAFALFVLATLLYWMWATGKQERALKVELEKNIKWLDRAQRTALIGFFSIDFSKRQIALSPMAAEILGAQKTQKLQFEDVAKHMPTAHLKKNLRKLLKIRSSRTPQKIEFDLRMPGQKTKTVECWCEIESHNHRDSNENIIGTLQDISQRKVIDLALEKYRTLLESQVRKDSLTGLSNRRALDEELDRAWRRAIREQDPLAVLVIDIDHFKNYNDHYGHLQGDSCLKQVAKVLEGHLLRANDQVFRFGGEEFVVLLPNTTETQAVQVANHLRCAVEAQSIENLTSKTHEMVTVSIGVASLIPSAVQNHAPCPLIAMGDQALYCAKKAGRNQVCVSDRAADALTSPST